MPNLFSANDKFDLAYELYKKPVYRKVYSYVNNQYDAEDITHTTFEKFYKIIDKLEDINNISIKSLILTIAKNAAIDFLRKKKPVPIEKIEDFCSDTSLSVEDIAVGNIVYTEILNTIVHMKDIYRDVLLLRCFFKFTAGETAELLSIKPGTVNVRLFKARQIIVEELKKNGK